MSPFSTPKKSLAIGWKNIMLKPVNFGWAISGRVQDAQALRGLRQ
jgi:hypothetical protein